MRVLFVTAEVFPLIKTGGLADVSAALPEALRKSGVDVRLLTPAYPQALARAGNVREGLRLGDPLGRGDTRLLEAELPGSKVPVWLVDCPALYDRPGGPYRDPAGREWADNHLRFALLNHVAAALANEEGARWRPNIVHANDWHAGLVPLLLARNGRKAPPVVFTIHNLAYQGLFDASCFGALGLPPDAYAHLEYYRRLSFLKAGIEMADTVTTVSPTYAAEILSPEFGCGMDGVLRARTGQPIGILNGIDCQLWNPERDPCLPANYSVHAMQGKPVCKRELRAALGLDESAGPLIAFTSRLSHQKMPDIVLDAVPALLESGAQFAVVAEGDGAYEAAFVDLAQRYPGQVAAQIGYDETLAHRLLGGADILLHPARFEPCGLVPLYAMRYGAVPVVRRCGGLADSVVDLDGRSGGPCATGFAFEAPTADGMIAAVRRAIDVFRQPLLWRRLATAGMTPDRSWRAPAQAYKRLYQAMIGITTGGRAPAAVPDQKLRQTA